MMGILGGTFDPIHRGHIEIARCAMRSCALDRVVFIPSGEPPHKRDNASSERRLDMVRLAIEDDPGFLYSDMEVRRSGVTYTVDTLIELKSMFPDDSFYYLVGADTFLLIESWRMFSLVAEILDGLVVTPRPGVNEQDAARIKNLLEQKYGLVVWMMGESGPDISSTAVREAVARCDKDLPDLLEPAIIRYIGEKGLYMEPIRARLMGTLSRERFRHTIAVETTAVEFAVRFGGDPLRVRVAALLHDCAKHMRPKDMLALIKANGLEPSEDDLSADQLLHAIAGVAVSKVQYGVHDEDVLAAIRWHTVGRANMSMTEKIVYLADAMEPGRRFYPGLDEIRAAAKQNLDQAVWLCAKRTYDYVSQKGARPHPNTLALLQSLGAPPEADENP